MRKKKFKKEVAFQDGVVNYETLPFPCVMYPGFYGAFFAFREWSNTPIFLCSCSKNAIKNYITFKAIEKSSVNILDSSRFLLSSHDFPLEFTEEFMKKKGLNSEEIFNEINFKDNLCHECNEIAPHYRYCHEMYGGAFKQTYGWYIEKQRWEFGIIFRGATSTNEYGTQDLKGPYSLWILSNSCPDSIISLLSQNNFHYLDEERNIVDYTIDRSQNNEIHNIVENTVREKFGFKKVGEAWVNETILYRTLKSMFPEYRVVHHYRPDFLNGLEIDVYIHELNTGFEYQGIQHLEPLKHFGGDQAHYDLKSRDKFKKKICEKMGIKLIYVSYKEDISEPLLKNKMCDS